MVLQIAPMFLDQNNANHMVLEFLFFLGGGGRGVHNTGKQKLQLYIIILMHTPF